MTSLRIAAVVTAVLIVAGCSRQTDLSVADGWKSESESFDSEPIDDFDAEPIAQKDFPKPDGVDVSVTAPDMQALMMSGPNRLQDYFRFYESDLRRKGWRKNKESEILDGVGYLKMNRGNLTIDMTFNPARDGKSVTIITLGNGVAYSSRRVD